MKRLDDEFDEMPENNPVRHDKRLGLGIVFIFIGLIFVLSNIGLIPNLLKGLFFSWQMILIVIGLFSVASNKNKTPGMVMIIIGVLFFMPGLLGFAEMGLIRLWPLALVALGAYILFRQKEIPGKEDYKGYDLKDTDADIIDDLNIFGGSNRNIITQNFKGGRVTCVFGGADYNFTRAGMAQNVAVLDVLTIFGGTKVVVPSDWAVTIDVVSIFGGFADKRHLANHSNLTPQNKLVIKGFTIFGGGEVKNI